MSLLVTALCRPQKSELLRVTECVTPIIGKGFEPKHFSSGMPALGRPFQHHSSTSRQLSTNRGATHGLGMSVKSAPALAGERTWRAKIIVELAPQRPRQEPSATNAAASRQTAQWTAHADSAVTTIISRRETRVRACQDFFILVHRLEIRVNLRVVFFAVDWEPETSGVVLTAPALAARRPDESKLGSKKMVGT
jgi:hypothetical protein